MIGIARDEGYACLNTSRLTVSSSADEGFMSALLETAVRTAEAPRADDLLEAMLSAAGDHAALLDSRPAGRKATNSEP